MTIHFINVGYGDAILMEIPGEKNKKPFRILIDTGCADLSEYPEDGPRILATDYLSLRGISKLDILIITHPHEDHIAMTIPLLKQLKVGEVWVNHLLPEAAWDKRVDSDSVPAARFLMDSLNSYSAIHSTCSEMGIPMKAMEEKGISYELTDDLLVHVLNNQNSQGMLFGKRLVSLFDKDGNVPIQSVKIREELEHLNRACNSSSLALLFEWKGKSILLTGDSCPGSWPDSLMEELTRWDIDVFKMPHHGQIDSINERAIKAICPRYVVTSSASDRRNNCPHPDCYKLIEKSLSEKPVFLFTDELKYEPYFEVTTPFRAIIINLAAEQQGRVEFDICSEMTIGSGRT